MKPLVSAITVNRRRADVFAFLDVLANHESFTDHYLVDWTTSGPRVGIGAAAHLRPKLPGPPAWLDMRVVDAEPGRRITEESVGAGGRRRSRGTYALCDADNGATHVRFEFVQLASTPVDKLFATLTRRWLQRGNDRALRRLAEQLATYSG